MKLSFLALFAFAAFSAGNSFVAAALSKDPADSDKTAQRLLRKNPEPVKIEDDVVVHVYERIVVEEVMVDLIGPDDYSNPSNEEIQFFIDSLMTAFEMVGHDSGLNVDFAALEAIEETKPQGRGDGRNLFRRRSWSWSEPTSKLLLFTCIAQRRLCSESKDVLTPLIYLFFLTWYRYLYYCHCVRLPFVP